MNFNDIGSGSSQLPTTPKNSSATTPIAYQKLAFLSTNILADMRAKPHWLLWKTGKVPIQAANGELADNTNLKHLCSFDGAINAALANPDRCNGIGFSFNPHNPFAGIDLDYTEDAEIFERQKLIFEKFNSYSEISPSGKGLHIIIKVTDKSRICDGRRRDKVEMYCQGRYFTMTGDVCNAVPIAHRQELAEILWTEMQSPKERQQTTNTIIDGPDLGNDDEIIQQAQDAANGELFRYLFNGEWQGLYPSQSEADFALYDIIAFYTESRKQVERIFRRSALGQRPKVYIERYLNYMAKRAWDNKLPPVEIVY